MSDKAPGSQRLSLEKLQKWEELNFGMFLCFGMSTYDGDELSFGTNPSAFYAPDRLDVGQWVSIARDCGMKYAVLTAKHTAGHCLWPTRHSDYHVGTSGNPTDVVEQFVEACGKCGVLPAIYYCSWDNHNRFGSITPSMTEVGKAFVTRAYLEFQSAQMEELLTGYGEFAEVWVDIPALLPRFYRQELYDQIVGHQPDTVVMMNNGIGDGSVYPYDEAWPADIISIERFLPNSLTGHVKWREIEGKDYYLPGEVCDPIGHNWFCTENDPPRSDAELLGMYLTSVSRGTNLLLSVGPDRHGLIGAENEGALQRLRKNLDKL